jgi:hypothetical protein
MAVFRLSPATPFTKRAGIAEKLLGLATLLFLGSGLLGLAGWGRLRKS